jgi:hypothetical protein
MKKAFYRCTVWLCCALFVAPVIVFSQTTLTAGDIVVLGFNADEAYPNQRWAFMTMVNLSAGTVINFTDNGYDGSTGQFRTGATNDGHMQWVTPGAILKGTVVYATNNTVNGSTSGVTGQLGAGSFGFSAAGDQIIVYQGTMGTATGATFIYAFNNGQTSTYSVNGNWQTSGGVTSDQLSYMPPGLTSTTAVALTSNLGNTSSGTGALGSANYGFDNMHYGGTTSGTKTALLTAASNATNWKGDNAVPWNLSAGGVFPSNTFTVLPVTLLNFTAEQETSESVQLQWVTAMEVNNDHFTIERSTDGVRFTTIGTVQSLGDNIQPAEYTFTDHMPEPGTNYYRLGQTDKDGKGKILGVRTVSVQNIALRIGPNPAVHFIEASFAAGAWQEVRLSNNAAQLLQAIPLAVSKRRIRIELSKHRPGIYYLAFIGRDGKVQVVKTFVKRE